MNAIAQGGITGCFVSFGLRTDELAIDICSPLQADNGCLDAPEWVPAGCVKRVLDLKNNEMIITSYLHREV